MRLIIAHEWERRTVMVVAAMYFGCTGAFLFGIDAQTILGTIRLATEQLLTLLLILPVLVALLLFLLKPSPRFVLALLVVASCAGVSYITRVIWQAPPCS
jgi:hypothetical protein